MTSRTRAACKTPILGLRRNAFSEIAGDGAWGIVVEHATPEAVAEGICAAFSDRQRLSGTEELGQRACLERCSWDRVAGLVVGVIQRALAREVSQ